MPLRRQYMRNFDRLYAPMVEWGTVRYRNEDGTLTNCVQQGWRMQWQPQTEAQEGASNETITTNRCTWRLFRKTQPYPPRVGDQIVARNGDVWEVVGPIEHKMRENIFLCPCVQSDMNSKVEAL